MRKLSRTKEDYFANNGWSSHNFIEIAKKAIPMLEMNGFKIHYGRHVMYLEKGSKYIKVYPHYKGRDRGHLTFVSSKGEELKTITPDVSLEEIVHFLSLQFENE